MSDLFLAITVVLDASSRPAALTRSHGDAMERAINATADQPIAGIDIIELPIAPQAFSSLRKHLNFAPTTVAMYDLFPVPAALDPTVRKTAGQFLAAEALWGLEEQGLLGSVPLNLKLALPNGWGKAPQEVRQKLLEAGALDLSAAAIELFRTIRARWDASAPAMT